MGVDPALDGTYFALCSLCAALNALVALYIVFHTGFRTAPMKIVLYLHSTLAFEVFFTMPKLFVGSILCDAVGLFRAYASLSNCVAVFVLVLHYRSLFRHGLQKIRLLILAYRERFIFIFPLISVFPLAAKCYGVFEDDWCELHADFGIQRVFALLFYFGWVFALSFLSAAVLVTTCYSVYSAHPKLMVTMFKSCGLYVVLGIFSWIPRLLAFTSAIHQKYTYLFVYVFGLGYFAVFCTKLKSLQEFEQSAARVESNCSSYFSWELGITESMHFSISDRPSNAASLRATVELNPIISSQDNSVESSPRSSNSRVSFSLPIKQPPVPPISPVGAALNPSEVSEVRPSSVSSAADLQLSPRPSSALTSIMATARSSRANDRTSLQMTSPRSQLTDAAEVAKANGDDIL